MTTTRFERTVKKAVKIMKEMNDSTDIDWIKERIRLTKTKYLVIICNRVPEDRFDNEFEIEYMSDPGTALSFEAYIMDDYDDAIEGITTATWSEKQFREDIEYLLKVGKMAILYMTMP